MFFVRQNATHKVVLGPAVAVGDGFTPVTNLAISTADEAEAILHDNGTVVDIAAYTWNAITTADGYYHLTLESGISSTVGQLTIIVNDDNLCLPLRADFTVVEEAVYDAQYAASATGIVGTAQTGDSYAITAHTDYGNAKLVRSTTPANSLDVANGAAEADLTYMLGTALTGTAAFYAASFKKFFNIETPTGTVNSLPDAVPGQAGGGFIAGTNAETTVTTAINANLIGNITGDLSGSVGSVSGAVGSVSGAVGSVAGNVDGNVSGSVGSVAGAVGSVTGAVGSVAGNVDGNVSGSVGSVAGAVGSVTGAVGSVAGNVDGSVASVGVGGIVAATFGAGAINAAAIANAAIDNATFASDVGSTVYASNTIALAVRKALNDYDPPTDAEMNLRTLLAADYFVVGDYTAPDNTGIGTIESVVTNGTYGNAAIRTRGDIAWITGTGGTTPALVWAYGTRALTSTGLNAITNWTVDVAGSLSGSVGSVSGAVGSVTGAAGSVTGAVGSVAGNVDGSVASVAGAVGSVSGAVGSVTGAVGSVTGAVGSVTGAVGSVAGNVDGSTASVTAKTGYVLASTGLDSIATTAPTGVASNFREMVVQVWRRFFKKSTLTSTQLKTYAANGTDVLTTQAATDDSTTQTLGDAS